MIGGFPGTVIQRLVCVVACGMLAATAAWAESPDPMEQHPGRTAYDRSVAWRAWLQSDTRPVIGIALGGGGARGMAHIGVLRALESAGIPAERIAGTSIGSFIGALYATGASIDRIEELALRTNWSNLIELKMSRIGFFSTRRLEQFINFHLLFLRRDILRPPSSRTAQDEYATAGVAELTFRDLKIPFVCTATDLYSGSVVVFDSGPVAAAVRASCSIPGLFEPVITEDHVLVDGGVRMNLPVSLCQRLGAQAIIAVDLESDTARATSGLVDVLAQIIRIQGRALMEAERMTADAVVAPAVGRIRMTDLAMTRDAIREGEIAGRLASDRIKDRLLGREECPEAGWPISPPATATRDSLALVVEVIRANEPGRSRQVRQTARLVRAALAASQIGLDRDAVTIAQNVPREARDPGFIAAIAASAIRAGLVSEAQKMIEELENTLAPPDAWWSLAAAAYDRRLDALAQTLVLRAESSEISQAQRAGS